MRRWLLALALLCGSPAHAGTYEPSGRWMGSVAPTAPVLPYRLGLVNFDAGGSGGYAGQFSEYYADLRSALNNSGLLDSGVRERAKLDYAVETFDYQFDQADERASLTLVMRYTFQNKGTVVSEQRVRSESSAAGYDSYSGVIVERALRSNLKLLLVALRSAHDPSFAEQGEKLTAAIADDMLNSSRTISGLMTDGFMGFAEGTASVVSGIADVGGAALEVAASPEFAATLNDEMNRNAAQQAQQQAFLDDLQQQQQAAIRERHAREQAEAEQQRRASASVSAAAAAPASVSTDTPSEIGRYTPVRNGSSGTGSWETAGRAASAATAPASGPTQSPAAAPAAPTSKATKGPTLIETSEAIFVCSIPDSAGRFECDSPVTAGLDGGPKSLPQWRTPELMVGSMTAACPDARRLASSTHLVWGCGFGATNNSNSMDRSAGVDVEGRQTFYCSERQTSCRRTSR